MTITLADYQRYAATWLRELPTGRGMLADDPGVGKTYPAIAAAEAAPGPRLVVCPSYLRWQWAEYLAAWGVDPQDVAIVDGSPARKHAALAAGKPWTITSYPVLAARNHGNEPRYPEHLRTAWGTVICDEAHHLRGRAKRRRGQYHASMPLAFDAARRLTTERLYLLTGTPDPAGAKDLYGPLRLLGVIPHRSYWRFVDDHLCTTMTPFKRQVHGPRDPRAFAAWLAPWILRRTLADVGLDLPVVDKPIAVPLKKLERTAHATLKKDYVFRHRGLDHPVYCKNAGEMIALLRGLTLGPPAGRSTKLEAVQAIAAEFSGEKIVVFCWYRRSVARTAAALGEARSVVAIDGGLSASKRAACIDLWRGASDGILVASLAIMEGVNLQCSRICIMVEEDWVEATNTQAIGRLRRRGQNRPVLVYRLRVSRSVDTAVASAAAKKDGDGLGAVLKALALQE